MKTKLLTIVFAAATFCGCSSSNPRLRENHLIETINSQKYIPLDGRKMTNDFDLYYLGWNDSADNIAHHILQN
jgi:hypothetical protein